MCCALYLPHSAAPEADQEYQEGLPTDKNWVDFAVGGYPHPNQFYAYLDATKQITDALALLLERTESQSVDDFRGQIQEFCDARRVFINSIDNTYSPSDVWR